MKIHIDPAGAGPGHPKDRCDLCGRSEVEMALADEDDYLTATTMYVPTRTMSAEREASKHQVSCSWRYVTLCRRCYLAQGNNVR